ncbi:MAG: ribonuclease D [Rickettsiales bacterium]
MSLQDIILFKNDLPDDLIIDGDLAIDTEAMGLNNKRDRLCLIQISNNQGKIYLVQFEKGVHSAPNLKKLLTNPNTQKILHFARFDMAILYEYLGIMIENVFCTKIASRLVRTYTDSHGLKDLCRELLSVQLSKQQQSSDWGAANLTKEQQLYAASDVIYLHAIRDRLESLLIREERKDLAQECFKFLSNRILLDLSGWNEVDIFAH